MDILALAALAKAMQGGGGGGMSDDAKEALLDLLEHVAYTDENGAEYLQTLEDALYNRSLSSITAVFTQGQAVIYDTDSLDTLKQYLVVTANYSDNTTRTVTGYTLSGTLTAGTSTITVSYGGKTDTFNATVTTAPLYPLLDKVTETEYYRVTTSRYGHVEVEVLKEMYSSASGAQGFTLNVKTGVLAVANNAGVNNQPKTFTIPANSQSVFAVTNISNPNSISFAGNYKLANSTSSVSGTGIGNEVHVNDAITTETVTSATDVYYVFFYLVGNPMPAGSKLSFDLSCTIGGVRYI